MVIQKKIGRRYHFIQYWVVKTLIVLGFINKSNTRKLVERYDSITNQFIFTEMKKNIPDRFLNRSHPIMICAGIGNAANCSVYRSIEDGPDIDRR